MNAATALNYPEWTEFRKKNGLDPLGMQNSSVNLYQMLLPGISNVTLRLRYYGLYAWLCWIYAKREGDTNPESWKRFIRRAEALYALIAAQHAGEGGVAGIEWAQKKLIATSGKPIDFGSDAEPSSPTYYLKQTWGAYGAAYASQLFEVGIFTQAEHAIPVPGPEIGDKLAQIFNRELGDSAEPFYATIKRGKVIPAELDAFAPLTPSEIKESGAERKLYEDILFARAGVEQVNDRSRRLSLLLILKIVSLLGRIPTAEEVRWILYAGMDRGGRKLGLEPDNLIAQRQRWYVYQANDLCHMALETLLKFVLDVLEAFPRGLAPASLLATCVKQIIDAAEFVPETWNGFLAMLAVPDNAYDAKEPASDWSLVQEIRRAGRNRGICGPAVAWKAVILLGLLHKRFRADQKCMTEELKGFDRLAFRSLLTESEFLEKSADRSFADTVIRVIEERVMYRHLWVALRKFRHQGDYTFLIEADEGLIRFREKDGPVFTNPRLGPSVTFLKDIHLIDDKGLTPRGVEVLQAP